MMMMTLLMKTLMVLMILMAEFLRLNPIEIYFKSLDIPIAFWAKPPTAYLQIALSTCCYLKGDALDYQVSTMTQNLEHFLIVKSCLFSVF